MKDQWSRKRKKNEEKNINLQKKRKERTYEMWKIENMINLYSWTFSSVKYWVLFVFVAHD